MDLHLSFKKIHFYQLQREGERARGIDIKVPTQYFIHSLLTCCSFIGQILPGAWLGPGNTVGALAVPTSLLSGARSGSQVGHLPPPTPGPMGKGLTARTQHGPACALAFPRSVAADKLETAVRLPGAGLLSVRLGRCQGERSHQAVSLLGDALIHGAASALPPSTGLLAGPGHSSLTESPPEGFPELQGSREPQACDGSRLSGWMKALRSESAGT